ncbi:ferritin-like domain-containing protein [Siccibacter colletis]|mgnify:FL=1|jgi:ferritin-like metal-binding protein YciE|uniref:YciE/YciF ferroxidase family protein n=1 Tax=Siccibacter colletis TaxID=1505757 RepID=UPI0004E26C02|nr:ferritin-like domain-containing protein [Siccibacter colletis]WNN46833.1 ferritin-like domain-containing protein [Siccibacter colletis]
MQIKTIQDLFVHLLSDTYSAEKQLTKALPKLARAASDEKLVQAFKAHLEETQGQIERIDQVVESVPELKLRRIKCVAMEGLVEEGAEVIEEVEKGPVRDAGLIAAAQKVEHYEIAAYGTLVTLAQQLGYKDAQKLLAATLEEEKSTDVKLTTIAESGVNKKASAA